MKLYYTKGACSFAVRVIINEIGLPCEYESVDLKTKKTQDGKDFLKINSKGAVPTLVTDNNEVLTENAVILQYLADTSKATQLLPAIEDFNRYRVLEWLNFVATELHKSVGLLFKPNLPEDFKQNFLISLIKSKITYVDEHLKNKKYLLGNNFTLPDAYMLVILNWLMFFKFDLSEWNNISKYYSELKQRPAVRKSYEEEGLRSTVT